MLLRALNADERSSSMALAKSSKLVAYLARLIFHRYAMLGVLESPKDEATPSTLTGKACPEYDNPTVIKKDGCDFCMACGFVGQCG